MTLLVKLSPINSLAFNAAANKYIRTVTNHHQEIFHAYTDAVFPAAQEALLIAGGEINTLHQLMLKGTLAPKWSVGSVHPLRSTVDGFVLPDDPSHSCPEIRVGHNGHVVMRIDLEHVQRPFDLSAVPPKDRRFDELLTNIGEYARELGFKSLALTLDLYDAVCSLSLNVDEEGKTYTIETTHP